MLQRTLIGAALAVCASAQSSMPSCMLQTNLGVTYDLSSLQQQNIRVNDVRNETTSTWYDYWFGVCQDLDDSFFAAYPQCWNTTGDNGVVSQTGYGPAFQVGKTAPVEKFCKRLGNTAAASGNLSVMGNSQFRRFLAQGVTLSYAGGDVCPDPYNSSNWIPRRIDVDFQCYDPNGFIPKYDVVQEDVQCTYHVMIKNRNGCPLECTRGGPTNRVCAGNGICGYDMSNGYAKCFCNTGWSGGDCTTPGDKGLPAPPDFSPNIAGGFFGGVFGGLAAAALFFAARSKMSGGGLFDAFTLGSSLSDFGIGAKTARAPGGAYSYAAAPAWSGAAAVAPDATVGYTAPDPTATPVTAAAAYAPAAVGGADMSDVYGAMDGMFGGGDGPLL